MKKYLLRYLFYWAPAFLASLLLRDAGTAAQVLRLFCAFFMLFGWAVNSGMAASREPRRTMAAILLYLGFALLMVNALYTGALQSRLGSAGVVLGGIFSYTPLEAIVDKMRDFRIPHEYYLTLGVAALCAIGWLLGLLYRFHNPDPSRPVIRKK